VQKAGINTNKFQAHSIRAVVVTKATMSRITVQGFMKAADWPGEGVLQKFYNKPSYSVEFGTSVLTAATTALNSHVDMETEPSKS